MMSEDTVPVNIWLQWYEYDDSEWAERTWCQDKQNDSDVEYIRADVAQAQLDAANARIAELEGNLSALHYDCNLYHEMTQQQLKGIHKLQTHIIERDARIAELEAAQAWVSVDERLPEPLADVLVVYGDYCVRGWLSEKAVWYMGLHPIPVTHWMPLPPPPVTDVTP